MAGGRAPDELVGGGGGCVCRAADVGVGGDGRRGKGKYAAAAACNLGNRKSGAAGVNQPAEESVAQAAGAAARRVALRVAWRSCCVAGRVRGVSLAS